MGPPGAGGDAYAAVNRAGRGVPVAARYTLYT
jgi:hypothetical protein